MAVLSIRRVRHPEMIEKGVPTDGKPWICDWRSYDIPQSIAGAILSAAPGLVAVSLSMLGGRKMIEAAESAAKKRGIRILWWFGPSINDLSQETKDRLRGYVKEARKAA